MLSLVQLSSHSITESGTSIQTTASPENETQYVSSQEVKPTTEQNSNGFFDSDTITLNLTNTDTENSSTINIFQLPVGDGDLPPSDAGGSIGRLGTTIAITPAQITDVTAITWEIQILSPPTSTTVFTGALPSPANVGADALVVGLNANTDTTWAWKTDIGGDYIFYMLDTSLNNYFQLQDLNGGANPFWKITNVFGVSGSAISIPSTEASDYNAITQELNNGCYELPFINVYADNIAQANREFVNSVRRPTGMSNLKISNPAINPMQKQFVNENVPVKFTPLAGNLLQYTVNAGESVRLIVKYIKNPACGGGTDGTGCLPNSNILNEQMNQCDVCDVVEESKVIPSLIDVTPPMVSVISIVRPTKPSTRPISPPMVSLPSEKPTVTVTAPIKPSSAPLCPIITAVDSEKPFTPAVEKPYSKPTPPPIVTLPLETTTISAVEKPIVKPTVDVIPPMIPTVDYEKPIEPTKALCPIITVIKTEKPIVNVIVKQIIVSPIIINVVNNCSIERKCPPNTNIKNYMKDFTNNDSIDEIFEALESCEYNEWD